MIYPNAFRSAGVGSAISVGKIGSVSGPVIGGILLSMHLPFAQMFYAASALLLIATIFSTVLAVLYKARFGEQHEQHAQHNKENAPVKEMRSALGDS
ncbi:hypothetical protein [Paraburkholderia phymatum]|uniref:hypothetical protein n=1 Tax=Paraburkholderia phymatum TaxID=148447 RepID=UPI003F7539C0